MPNRRQAITWTNDYPVDWSVKLWLIPSSDPFMVTYQSPAVLCRVHTFVDCMKTCTCVFPFMGSIIIKSEKLIHTAAQIQTWRGYGIKMLSTSVALCEGSPQSPADAPSLKSVMWALKFSLLLASDEQTFESPVILNAHEPLTRYAKLRVMHAPGMPGTFSPPPSSKQTTY